MTKSTAGKSPAKSAAPAASKAAASRATSTAKAPVKAAPLARTLAKPALPAPAVPAAKRVGAPRSPAKPASTRVHPRSVATLPPAIDTDDVLDPIFTPGAQGEIDPDLRFRMISDVAYRRFVERGHADGGDMDDWLQAEAEVDHLLANGSPAVPDPD